MRAQGFDVPAPARTSNGWAVIVHAGAPDLTSSRFREAMFVTCGPLGGPLSGDLVLGGQSPQRIDRFVSCMRSQGFDLPRPRKQPNGDHVFDLRTSIHLPPTPRPLDRDGEVREPSTRITLLPEAPRVLVPKASSTPAGNRHGASVHARVTATTVAHDPGPGCSARGRSPAR